MLESVLNYLKNQGYLIRTTAMNHSNIVLFDNTQITIQPSLDKLMFQTVVHGIIHQRFMIPNLKNSQNSKLIINKLAEWINFYSTKELATQYLQDLIQKGYTIQNTNLYKYTLRLSKENSLLIYLDHSPKPFSLAVHQKKLQLQSNSFEKLTDLKNTLKAILLDYQFTPARFDQLLADFKNQGYHITKKDEVHHIQLPNNIELEAELVEDICYVYFFAEQQLKMVRQALTSGDFYNLIISFCKENQVFLMI